MGIDKMLAVGAASHGSLLLLLFGLRLSSPFVVFMSNVLSKLMDRYPIILWVGAAILGRVGGQMMITNPWVHTPLQPSTGVVYAVEVFFVVFVCGLAKPLLPDLSRQRQGKRASSHLRWACGWARGEYWFRTKIP